MDPQPNPFPRKTESLKQKISSKSTDPSRTIIKDPSIPRKNRVFGTIRRTNIQLKPTDINPAIKPLNGFLQNHPKPTTKHNLGTNVTSTAVTQKIPLEKPKPRLKKKSITSQEKVVSMAEAKTPVTSPFAIKSKVAETPYYTAGSCSKCSLCTCNKLETSSYWLAQIKLAESASKHFVSVAFFRLAFHCNTQPMKSLETELEQYLERHGVLSTQTEWKDVLLLYGLLKDEMSGESANLDSEKSGVIKAANGGVSGEEFSHEWEEVKVEELQLPDTN